MIPVLLDPARVRTAVAGQGPLAVKRLRLLQDGGARPVVFASQDDADLRGLAGAKYRVGLPTAAEISTFHLVFVAGIPDAEAEPLVLAARAVGTLINVEDVIPLCDLHVPSIVRRGDLVMSVSTGGRSPALARLLRETLERLFPAVWARRLDEAAALRARLRAEGKDGPQINAAVASLAATEKWLP